MIAEDLGHCPACGSGRGEILSLPEVTRSITSGGIILDKPLGRVQCLDCGLLRQKLYGTELKNELYREKYGLYHRRPGTAQSEARRYAAMAEWIFAALAPYVPTSILDIGCGGGMLLEALRRVHPDIRYAGIDPSQENSELARSRDFYVTTGFVPGTRLIGEAFDLVLCSNVLSHIPDTQAFLAEMADMASPTGRVLVYSHDGQKPGADLLWTDIDYSFCREHIGAIAARAGLELLPDTSGTPPPLQHDKQILVFRRNVAPPPAALLSGAALDGLLAGRRTYLRAWQELAHRLDRKAAEATGPVLNFGASFWALLLAAYCPGYWKKVDACVVDDQRGTFLDKKVIATEDIAPYSRPLIVLGANPAQQQNLAKRLAVRGDVVVWFDLIDQ